MKTIDYSSINIRLPRLDAVKWTQALREGISIIERAGDKQRYSYQEQRMGHLDCNSESQYGHELELRLGSWMEDGPYYSYIPRSRCWFAENGTVYQIPFQLETDGRRIRLQELEERIFQFLLHCMEETDMAGLALRAVLVLLRTGDAVRGAGVHAC